MPPAARRELTVARTRVYSEATRACRGGWGGRGTQPRARHSLAPSFAAPAPGCWARACTARAGRAAGDARQGTHECFEFALAWRTSELSVSRACRSPSVMPPSTASGFSPRNSSYMDGQNDCRRL
eukprot:836274-Prymnesium_polylepis.1